MAEQSVNATYLNEIYAATEDEKIKRNRGMVYSLVQSGWPLGVFLAAGFTALLLPLVGWRGVFLLATLPAFALVIIRRRLNETPQYRVLQQLRSLRKAGRGAEADALAREHGFDQDNGAPFAAIFNKSMRRNTILLSLVWIFNFFGVTTFTVLGTTLLKDGKGIPFSTSLVIFIGEPRRVLRIPLLRRSRTAVRTAHHGRNRVPDLGRHVRGDAAVGRKHGRDRRPLRPRPVLHGGPVRRADVLHGGSATARTAGPRGPPS
jgi:MFS family permease